MIHFFCILQWKESSKQQPLFKIDFFCDTKSAIKDIYINPVQHYKPNFWKVVYDFSFVHYLYHIDLFSAPSTAPTGVWCTRAALHTVREILLTHIYHHRNISNYRGTTDLETAKLSGLSNFKRNRRNHTFKIKELDVLLKHIETFRTQDIYQKQTTNMTHSKLPKRSDIKKLHVDQCINMTNIPSSLADEKQSLWGEQSAFIFNKVLCCFNQIHCLSNFIVLCICHNEMQNLYWRMGQLQTIFDMTASVTCVRKNMLRNGVNFTVEQGAS